LLRLLVWGLMAGMASAGQTTATDAAAGVNSEGLIGLDVVVVDATGQPVAGLRRDDFAVLDDGIPRPVVSFSAHDGGSAKSDSQVQLILLVDTFGETDEVAEQERSATEQFLREHNGQLEMPTTVYALAGLKFWRVAGPSLDGAALASALGQNRMAGDNLLSGGAFAVNGPPGSLGLNGGGHGPAIHAPDANLGIFALGWIAAQARTQPGRKVLLWVGPGFRTGTGKDPINSGINQKNLFLSIRWYETVLREARLALTILSVGPHLQTNVLAGPGAAVGSEKEADILALSKGTLAVRSGGVVLPAERDLEMQISRGAGEAEDFYHLTFDPAPADRVNALHSLHISVPGSGRTVRTTMEYYDQPFYHDTPDAEIRQVTVAQLRQFVEQAHSRADRDVTAELEGMGLNRRLPTQDLAALLKDLPGKRSREALTAEANLSEFLAPSPDEIPTTARPTLDEQRQLVDMAARYLSQTMPHLPDFFATRTLVRYSEGHLWDGFDSVKSMPPRVVGQSRASVVYRNGREIVSAEQNKRGEAGQPNLETYGTFGPLLRTAAQALIGGVQWIRWESWAGGRRAVFTFDVPASKAHYLVHGCCTPNLNGTEAFATMAANRGEIAIDPSSGAILRLTVQSDQQDFLPVDRSEMVIDYGPVTIGGKSYILPLHSVNVGSQRSLMRLENNWYESFWTWGPYTTQINVFDFDDYHTFRGSAHMLPGFNSSENPPR